MGPVFWISGPPGAGKSTLCAALLNRFRLGYHLRVDDLREWAVQGGAGSVPWTEETERQFRIAESASCDVARRYALGGFAVAIDHCRNPVRLEALLQSELSEIPVVRVCLMPDLEENLRRSHTRTNKSFDPHMLDETIVFTNAAYRNDLPVGWKMIDNTRLSVEETIDRILS